VSSFRKNVAKKQRIGKKKFVDRLSKATTPRIYPLPNYKDLVDSPPFFESGYNDPEITFTLTRPFPDYMKDRLVALQSEMVNEMEAPDFQYISTKEIEFFAFEGRNLKETQTLIDELANWFINHGVEIEAITVEEGDSLYQLPETEEERIEEMTAIEEKALRLSDYESEEVEEWTEFIRNVMGDETADRYEKLKHPDESGEDL